MGHISGSGSGGNITTIVIPNVVTGIAKEK